MTATTDARHLTGLQLSNDQIRNLINTARTRLAAAAGAGEQVPACVSDAAAFTARVRHMEALAAAQAAGKALVVARGLDAVNTWDALRAQPDSDLRGWAGTFAGFTDLPDLSTTAAGVLLSNAEAFQHLVEQLLGQPYRSCAVCAPAKVG